MSQGKNDVREERIMAVNSLQPTDYTVSFSTMI
jgi:hypothetical protein